MSLFTRWRKKLRNESSGTGDDTSREATGPIGLDIAASSLCFCQLQSRADGRYRVLAKYRVEFDGERHQLLDDSGRFRSLVQQALRSKPFRGRRVCASVPPDQLRILPISYRARVENPDQEILHLVERRLKQPAEELVVDYLPLRRHPDDEEHVVLASAAERQHIDRLLRLLTTAGTAKPTHMAGLRKKGLIRLPPGSSWTISRGTCTIG
jgi:Tfp pilus assembly PilM family ATPase